MRLLWLHPEALPYSIPRQAVCSQWTDGIFQSYRCRDIPSDGFSCFLEISILREICFLILEAAEPAFNHDIIGPSTFVIHALPDSVITNKVDVFVTGKLAALIRVVRYYDYSALLARL